MDAGKLTCVLSDLVKQLNINGKEEGRKLIEALLQPFVKDFEFRAMELENLFSQYYKCLIDKPHIQKQITMHAVAEWIFYTNKIENAGMQTEEDTMAVISGVVITNSQQKLEVSNTYDLLKETYKNSYLQCEDMSQISFDIIALNKWHSALFHQVFESRIIGSLRKSGTETSNTDGSPHFYPHHSIVEFYLKTLCKITHALMKAIPVIYTEKKNRILYCFALASFVQYHFVDIHPYLDGNGRMCRLLSKFILDWICPIPFPMFKDKKRYFDALILGRKDSCVVAPKRLLSLLMDSATIFYRDMIDTYLERPFDTVIAADTLESLKEQVKIYSKVDVKAIVSKFNELTAHQSENVKGEKQIFCIKKLPEISWDDLLSVQ